MNRFNKMNDVELWDNIFKIVNMSELIVSLNDININRNDLNRFNRNDFKEIKLWTFDGIIFISKNRLSIIKLFKKSDRCLSFLCHVL